MIKAGKDTQTFAMKKPVISDNPVLPGQYTAPDIDYMDGKFWIFPITDGYPNWTGTVFHAFSSTNMVDWEDEGTIMDLANDNPGKNDKGIQISPSLWAVGSAFAKDAMQCARPLCRDLWKHIIKKAVVCFQGAGFWRFRPPIH